MRPHPEEPWCGGNRGGGRVRVGVEAAGWGLTFQAWRTRAPASSCHPSGGCRSPRPSAPPGRGTRLHQGRESTGRVTTLGSSVSVSSSEVMAGGKFPGTGRDLGTQHEHRPAGSAPRCWASDAPCLVPRAAPVWSGERLASEGSPPPGEGTLDKSHPLETHSLGE